MTPSAARRLFAVLLVLATVGCGVPSDRAPRQVDQAEVPFGLLSEPSSPAAEDPADRATAGRPLAFFITDADRLLGVPLEPGPEALLPAAIAELSAGPDRSDRSRGLGTAIPPGLTLAVTRVDRGTATIDLRGEPGPVGEQSPLAVAQIVLTATSVPDVERVVLTRQGEPLEAQLPDGGLTSAPLSAQDYLTLRVWAR